MKKQAIAFLFLICLFLTACSGVGEPLKLQLCGAYAVPGMLHFDMKGPEYSCEEIETDSKGRILFKFTGKNLVYDEEKTYFVICQKSDTKNVYFYEDLCYAEVDQSSESIEQLKLENDWGKALDITKMTHRPIKISLDLFLFPDRILEAEDVRAACIKEFIVLDLILLDVSPSGQELHFVRAINNQANMNYVLFISPEQDVKYIEITDLMQDIDKIVAFKKECLWKSH